MEIACYQRKGVPAICRLHWQLSYLLGCIAGGIYALNLALYIALWVRKRGGRGWSFLAFAVLALLVAATFLPDGLLPRHLTDSLLSDLISLMALILWLGGSFLLRAELIRHYAPAEGEGGLEIGRFWTAILGVFYLNYCLWVVRDSA